MVPILSFTRVARDQRRAFTIVELLVAVGVTAVLVTLMVTITINLLNGWNRSSGRLAANATARLILDQLDQDLSGAIMKRDGNVWLAATVQANPGGAYSEGYAAVTDRNWSTSQKPHAPGTPPNDSLRLGAAKTEDLRFGKLGVWLRFFTIQPDSNDGKLQNVSAPRAISYQLVRRNVGTTAAPQYSYQLYRAEVRPYHSNSTTSQTNSTFGMGYDLYTTVASSYNHTSTGNEKDASNIRNPNVNQLIGNNVVDFGLRLFERNSAGKLVEVFPVDRRVTSTPPTTVPVSFAATSNTTRTLSLANTPESGTPTYGFPVEAEVMIRVLTSEGERFLQALESGNATFADSWWEIVEKHSVVFTRRIAIRSTPL